MALLGPRIMHPLKGITTEIPVTQRQGSTEELNHTRTPSCPEEG